MKGMLKIAVVAAMIVAIAMVLSCAQSPEKNPVIQKKFKDLADLTDRVQSLDERMKTVNTDLLTILDDITALKQEVAKADTKAIQEMAARLDKIEGQLKSAGARREEAKVSGAAAEKKGAAEEKPAVRKARSREAEYVVPKGFYHDVKAGDTLESLAKQYGLSASKIAEANRLPSGAELRAGQKLFIPKAK